jgi:predicted dithiol-disulfide oxidoreductase (DUF899 family)
MSIVLDHRRWLQRQVGRSPWASSFGDDLSFDLSVAFTNLEQYRGKIEYNHRREAALPDAVLQRGIKGEDSFRKRRSVSAPRRPASMW